MSLQKGEITANNVQSIDATDVTAIKTALGLENVENGAEVNTINSDPTGVTGADQVINVISLTQAEFDAIATPNASTLYVING